MPNCHLCGAHFPNRLVVNGQLRNVHNRRYCLECSPWGLHNVRRLEGLREREPQSLPIAKTCSLCGQKKPVTDFYLRTEAERSHHWCKTCTDAHLGSPAEFTSTAGCGRPATLTKRWSSRATTATWHAQCTVGARTKTWPR